MRDGTVSKFTMHRNSGDGKEPAASTSSQIEFGANFIDGIHDVIASAVPMTIELPDHDYDPEDGYHDPGECQKCIEKSGAVVCSCNCGDCCRNLIVETTLNDAAREPLIAKRGKPYRDFEDVVGYLLNDRDNGNACTFFDQATNRCTIWDTRPGLCRLFNCDDPERQAQVRGEL